MEALFQTILITSLYASVAGVVIILLKRLLGNRLSPKWHYLIWFVLIAKLLMPFGPESAFSLFNAVPQLPAFAADIASNPASADNPATHVLAVSDDRPLQAPGLSEQTPVAGNAKLSIPELLKIGADNKVYVLSRLWLAGLLIFAAGLLYSHYTLRRKLKRSRRAPASVSAILDECRSRAEVRRRIRIIVQNEIKTPALFGVIRPKILISPAVLKLSDKEIAYIFLHELAHYQRHDVAANYLLLALRLIHWFNPVLWYCFTIMRHDMEVAADHRALSVLNPAEQKEYGLALLSVLETFNTARFMPKLIGMVDEKHNIKRRIGMIRMAEMFQKRRKLFWLTGLLCVVLLAGVLLTGPLTQPPGPPEQPSGLLPAESLPASAATIEEAVSQAILKQGEHYMSGEMVVEGHVVLDIAETNGEIVVYTIASAGNFGFENAVFTKVSGSGAIPTVITLRKNEHDRYELLKYQEPQDGEGYSGSVRKLFPLKLWPQVLPVNDELYAGLIKQQEDQAAAYLQRIGRKAPVQAHYVQRELFDLPVAASNKLFAELTKYDQFLNNCPYWNGSREIVENGERYIYETSQSQVDGYDVITFRQSKADGSIVKEKKYKIVGDDLELMP